MKRNFILIIGKVLVLFSFIAFIYFISCSKSDVNKNLIYTSIDPIKFIIDNIKSDDIQVNTILKPGNDPHTFEVTPKDIQLILNSNAYFYTDLPFEKNIVDKIKKQNKNFNMASLFQIGQEDPHIWLSIKNINIISENTLNELKRLYPAKGDLFDQNYKIFVEKLGEIENIIRFNLNACPVKKFLIIHPALTCFAQDWGLTQIALEKEGKIPTGSYLIELSKKIKEENLKFIFSQSEFPSSQIAQFIKDNNLKEVKINFLSYELFKTLISISETLLNEGKE